MSMATFYYPTLNNDTGQLIHLEGREAWHALGVRRLQKDDPVRVIDGRGNVADVIVDRVAGQNEAWLRIKSIHHVTAQQPDIVLASAIAKGDRQSSMLDMTTQLGISAYQPLQCERSVSKPGKNTTGRWGRVCLEACKQSGSAWLPEILQPKTPADAVLQSVDQGRQVIVAHPDGAEVSKLENSAAITVLIGPEGGFTSDEMKAMTDAGALSVSLGANILRIESAAISLLARLRIT